MIDEYVKALCKWFVASCLLSLFLVRAKQASSLLLVLIHSISKFFCLTNGSNGVFFKHGGFSEKYFFVLGGFFLDWRKKFSVCFCIEAKLFFDLLIFILKK